MLRFLRLVLFGAAFLSMQSLASAENGLRIGWQTGDVQVLLSYADKSGLFSRAGLKYSMHPFPAGPAMLPAIAANEVDIAWMGEFPAVTGYANKIPLTIFMIEQEFKSHIRLVVQPDSGIRTLADLRGKKIGVTFGSSGHNHILIALEKGGLKASDVTLVNLQPGHMPGAFVTKAVDAVLTWESNVGVIEKNGGVPIATTDSIGTTLIGVWVVRQQYLKENPDNIQKFLRAWEMAMDRFSKDRLSVLKPEADRLGQTPEGMAEVVDRQQSVRPSYREQLTVQYLGGPNDGKELRLNRHFGNIAKFMFDLKRIEAIPADWRPLISTGPLTTYLAKPK